MIPWHRLFSIGIALGMWSLTELDSPDRVLFNPFRRCTYTWQRAPAETSLEVPPEEAAPGYTDNHVLLSCLVKQ